MVMGAQLEVDKVDYGVVGKAVRIGERAEALSDFLTGELAKVGGQATIVVDNDIATVEWQTPDLSDAKDSQQVAYVSHLLQAGLLADPLDVIARTAYAGGVNYLAMNLLSINSTGKNAYMAERDARLLVRAAPLSVQALSTLGLILLENGDAKEAAVCFAEAEQIDQWDFLSSKYLAVALTVSLPEAAVVHAEKAMAILASKGMAPDAHMRAAYGMALLAAGMRVEAGMQFMLACGSRKPAMTPAQWVNGGYRVVDTEIAERLAPKGKKA